MTFWDDTDDSDGGAPSKPTTNPASSTAPAARGPVVDANGRRIKSAMDSSSESEEEKQDDAAEEGHSEESASASTSYGSGSFRRPSATSPRLPSSSALATGREAGASQAESKKRSKKTYNAMSEDDESSSEDKEDDTEEDTNSDGSSVAKSSVVKKSRGSSQLGKKKAKAPVGKKLGQKNAKANADFTDEEDSDSRGASSTGGIASKKKRGRSEEPETDDEDDDGGGDGGDYESLYGDDAPMPAFPKESHVAEVPAVPLDLGNGVQVPAAINRYLFPFQRDCAVWMGERYNRNPREGAILGLCMGLGKTVISVSFVAAILGKTGTNKDKDIVSRQKKAGKCAEKCGGPILILCPSAIVQVWIQHFKKWGHFLAKGESKTKAVKEYIQEAKDGKLEIVVTSFEAAIKLQDQMAETFNLVICDEVHKLKNKKTKMHKAVKAIRKFRGVPVYGLTGTPIQNELKELWTLMRIIAPKCLRQFTEFNEHFVKPILLGRKSNASVRVLDVAEERTKELSELLKRYLLAKDKQDTIADKLTKRTVRVLFCKMSEVQSTLYRAILCLPEAINIKVAREPCTCGRDEPKGDCCFTIPWRKDGNIITDEIDPRAVMWQRQHPEQEACERCPFCCGFAVLSLLQKAANHPALLQVPTDQSISKEKREKDLSILKALPPAVVNMLGGSERSQRIEDMANVARSGKLMTLETLLKKFKADRCKVLLFSYSTQVLSLLQTCIKSWGMPMMRIDGTTPAQTREGIVEDYNETAFPNAFLLLVSTKAGGVGLNMTSANRVILFDVCWNPADDHQAMERAHRIGQKRDVEIYRLASEGTIEELTYMRQSYKTQITNTILKDEGGGRRQFNGVQGMKGEEGELFGMSNLLTYTPGGILAKIKEGYRRDVEARGNYAKISGRSPKLLTKNGAAGVEGTDEEELKTLMKEALQSVKKEDEAFSFIADIAGITAIREEEMYMKDDDDVDGGIGSGDPDEDVKLNPVHTTINGVALPQLNPPPAGFSHAAMSASMALAPSTTGAGAPVTSHNNYVAPSSSIASVELATFPVNAVSLVDLTDDGGASAGPGTHPHTHTHGYTGGNMGGTANMNVDAAGVSLKDDVDDMDVEDVKPATARVKQEPAPLRLTTKQESKPDEMAVEDTKPAVGIASVKVKQEPAAPSNKQESKPAKKKKKMHLVMPAYAKKQDV